MDPNMREDPITKGPKEDWKGWFTLGQFVVQTHNAPLHWLLKRWGTRGQRADGLEAVLALVVWLPAFFGMVTPAAGDTSQLNPVAALTVCWWFSLALLACHKIKTTGAIARGARIHSREVGRSLIGGNAGEVAICLVGGLLLMPFCVGAGSYLLLGVITLPIEYGVISAREALVRRQLSDAEIEQQWVSSLRGRR